MPKRTEVDHRARALRGKVKSTASAPESAHPPTWIEPQLTRLAEEAPQGTDWLHEIKYDGYRMHARIEVSYQGQREDMPARQVVRSIPHPQ